MIRYRKYFIGVDATFFKKVLVKRYFLLSNNQPENMIIYSE